MEDIGVELMKVILVRFKVEEDPLDGLLTLSHGPR